MQTCNMKVQHLCVKIMILISLLCSLKLIPTHQHQQHALETNLNVSLLLTLQMGWKYKHVAHNPILLQISILMPSAAMNKTSQRVLEIYAMTPPPPPLLQRMQAQQQEC